MNAEAKTNIKALKEVADSLKTVYESYRHTEDMTGRDIICTGLPLPHGCAGYKDVKKDNVYRVSYTGYIEKNHYRAIKKLYKQGKTITEKKELIQKYIDRYKKE